MSQLSVIRSPGFTVASDILNSGFSEKIKKMYEILPYSHSNLIMCTFDPQLHFAFLFDLSIVCIQCVKPGVGNVYVADS